MKQIINDKIYNTKTAERIAQDDNGLGCNDFRYIDEVLYQTKKGQFFLDGKGGALTEYSIPVGNMTGGSQKLILFTENEAKDWLESHSTTEEYETVFTPEEG